MISKPSPSAEEFEYGNIEDGQVFLTEGATLEAIYTPGHTVDHVSFILHEEQVNFFYGFHLLGKNACEFVP